MPPTERSKSARHWLLPLLALAVGILGMVAVWLAAYLHFRTPSGWLALVAALDIALMLRLAAAPAGRLRAGLAVAGTAAAIALGYWMMAATEMGLLLGLTPLESSQRLGPVLFGELLRHTTSGWDIAWALLALPLAWRLGR
ncbi:hypothetical protein [Arenimonas metalli]|uniref:Uncharacterized protein n=1 Tax=Arenimonas metalli CF5-1 TaxID=1384056 RepID=A0A091B7W7_9GAMM|nr:hypothetical protein [Arenimonas metalli]KFN47831.1 hypothetical protein N787_07770 [Arenimonas metalli CF5-1]